ncbi:MAG: Dabb family protein [Phycisphaeraceae bacterium]|nr:Dabb family protein [Phycisphaeraceae bacterium]
MIVHSVFFWLKPNLTEQDRERFLAGVGELRSVQSIRHIFIGPPASTARPVIDRSYSVALTVVFDDMAAHDRYQEDPIHKRFVEQFSPMWERVLIYDSEESQAKG